MKGFSGYCATASESLPTQCLRVSDATGFVLWNPSGIQNHFGPPFRWRRSAQPPANHCSPSGTRTNSEQNFDRESLIALNGRRIIDITRDASAEPSFLVHGKNQAVVCAANFVPEGLKSLAGGRAKRHHRFANDERSRIPEGCQIHFSDATGFVLWNPSGIQKHFGPPFRWRRSARPCCLYTIQSSGQKVSHAIAKSIILRIPTQTGNGPNARSEARLL